MVGDVGPPGNFSFKVTGQWKPITPFATHLRIKLMMHDTRKIPRGSHIPNHVNHTFDYCVARVVVLVV